MYQKEKRIIFSLISTFVILAFYILYINKKYLSVNPDIIHDFQFWGKTMLILIPVMIVAQIMIHIIFYIINRIVTNEEIPTISDEMDKLIELKSIKINQWISGIGFVLAMATQAFGMQAYMLVVTLISFCFLGNVASSLSQVYYYRKGV